MDLFRRFSCILFLSTLYIQGRNCGTVQTLASIKATNGSSVDLTCEYTLAPGDSVYSGLIVWQAKTSGTSDFENIATFSPPGAPGGGNNSFTTTNSSMNLKDRAELLEVTSEGPGTYRAVMRVLEVQCLDEKEYRCSVTFISTSTGPHTRTAVTSLTVQAPAERPYDIPVAEPSNIEENMKINLSCTANVGKPPGKIKWWRYRDQVNAPLLMGESSEIPAVQPGVCVYNVTFSIQPLVTKDDDQSVWRCSVDNELLTSSPDQDKPNQETARINVFYKVRGPRIAKIPDTPNSQYSVGSSVTLTCEAEGNPSPSTNIDKNINKYVWTFKANPGDNATELSSNNGILSLNNLQETDTGTYTCTAFNGFNGKTFNSSQYQELQIGPTGNPGTESREEDTTGGLSGGAIAGIVIGVIVILVLVVVAALCLICRNRQSKGDSIDEPPEKPIRNNQDLSFVNRPDIVNNDKSSPFYSQEKKHNTDLHYSDLTFDDKPRSRKPIQIYDLNGLNNSPYSSEVMMPSV
ncbi:cell adhesion molecule 3-like isoform X2 [Crassostrea angulata]|uniref:cell adhesion molecule 3-like isoform X2 n=1 Tax=Magallana angulata TaxID=2784310 RepID=UPI0022B1CF71|nr:cell adhesion molecule 3-like isoform X2 [Crassostrea angulata]